MRSGGIHWLAVLAAGVAFYLIGFLIYGMLIPEETWMAMSGETAEELAAVGESRMPFGPVMPIMTALFMALIFKWGGVAGAGTGVRWGLVIALASAVPTLLYGWVYGVGPIEMTLIDGAHLMLGHAVVGAILGGWR
jgi:predicted membrane channel-forming protein YqfA (hemolysin III family)